MAAVSRPCWDRGAVPQASCRKAGAARAGDAGEEGAAGWAQGAPVLLSPGAPWLPPVLWGRFHAWQQRGCVGWLAPVKAQDAETPSLQASWRSSWTGASCRMTTGAWAKG